MRKKPTNTAFINEKKSLNPMSNSAPTHIPEKSDKITCFVINASEIATSGGKMTRASAPKRSIPTNRIKKRAVTNRFTIDYLRFFYLIFRNKNFSF